ncbi:MAG: 50S ribosomal protein L22 [Candidatus Woesearchaeota archaeon]|nr:50S ribosomal protein L22 [Candidatus Woesearchaeota archaeon]
MVDETQAKIVGKDLSISTKQSIEIANFIRGKNIEKAKNELKKVIEKKLAIPFKRYNRDMGHKKGNIAAGRYPKNAAKEFLNLLNGLEANAQNKGLSTNLIIKTIIPNKASRPWHYGRRRRIKMKRTHIEIIAEEIKKETKK